MTTDEKLAALQARFPDLEIVGAHFDGVMAQVALFKDEGGRRRVRINPWRWDGFLVFERTKQEARARLVSELYADYISDECTAVYCDEVVDGVKKRVVALSRGEQLDFQGVDARKSAHAEFVAKVATLPADVYALVVELVQTSERGRYHGAPSLLLREARWMGRPYARADGANIDFAHAPVSKHTPKGRRPRGADPSADAWDDANGFEPAFDIATAIGPAESPGVEDP